MNNVQINHEALLAALTGTSESDWFELHFGANPDKAYFAHDVSGKADIAQTPTAIVINILTDLGETTWTLTRTFTPHEN